MYGIVVMLVAAVAVLALLWPRPAAPPNRQAAGRAASSEVVGAAGNTMAVAVVNLETIVDTRPDSLYVGTRVLVEGVTVLDVVGDRAFWIGPDWDRRILVLYPRGATPRRRVQKNEVVDVQGLVQRLPLNEPQLEHLGVSKDLVLGLKNRFVYMEVEEVRRDHDAEERPRASRE